MKFIFLFLLVLSSSTVVDAQQSKWSNEQFSSLIDSIVANTMEEYNVPGTSYAIVKNNEVIHLGVKGFANIESRELIKPDTKFMFGSIAKLFTTLAVLQLYEEGKVELDVDINNYLKAFQLPYQVTLRQLLTHTAGLEESIFDRVKLAPDEFLPLEEYLKWHIPEQILIPGEAPAYSNHGMALAGLVVQNVSGLPFEEFIRKRIFIPLGMTNSSFKLDDNSKENMAVPYPMVNGNIETAKLEYVQTIPASMLISTPEDMTRFMMFLLNNDKLVKSETLSLMLKTQYSPHPKLWGRAFGFFERNYRGKHVLEHGGSRNGFYGQISIIPEDSIGVFVITNGGRSSFRNTTIFNFLGSIYPKIGRGKNFTDNEINLSDYTGTYLSNRRVESNFGKLILQTAYVEKIKVEVSASNSLFLLGSTFQAEAEDQFDISGDSTTSFPIAFSRNKNGTVNALLLSGRSDSFRMMQWFEHELIGVVTFIVALLLFLVLIILQARRLVKGKNSIQLKRDIRSASTFRLIFCVTNFTFLSLLIGIIIFKGESLQYNVPDILYPVFSLPIIGIFALVIMIYFMSKTWHEIPKKIKIGYVLLILFSLIYIWQLHFWNFIGFQF